MPSHLKEKIEKIEKVLEGLTQESASGIPVVVEGQHDFRTLRHLGVQGQILTAKTAGRSRLDLLCQIEESHVKEIILLFDFDRRGKEWTKMVRKQLEESKVKPNVTCWNALLALIGREVKDVEGLDTYLETLRRKTGQTKQTVYGKKL